MLLEPAHLMEAISTDPDGSLNHAGLAPRRKRKADGSDNNERLSKRMSLLNLERTGNRLYVPVENPSGQPGHLLPSLEVPSSSSPPRSASKTPPAGNEDAMRVDDSKYKVYIYDLDDELSSESEPEDGRLVLLPDIEKHLRASRIPPAVLPNSEGELAGMQLVLYNVPSSLSVPQEQDSVRKAIIEARARLRDRQHHDKHTAEVEGQETTQETSGPPKITAPLRPITLSATAAASLGIPHWDESITDDKDPDAMDLG